MRVLVFIRSDKVGGFWQSFYALLSSPTDAPFPPLRVIWKRRCPKFHGNCARVRSKPNLMHKNRAEAKRDALNLGRKVSCAENNQEILGVGVNSYVFSSYEPF